MGWVCLCAVAQLRPTMHKKLYSHHHHRTSNMCQITFQIRTACCIFGSRSVLFVAQILLFFSWNKKAASSTFITIGYLPNLPLQFSWRNSIWLRNTLAHHSGSFGFRKFCYGDLFEEKTLLYTHCGVKLWYQELKYWRDPAQRMPLGILQNSKPKVVRLCVVHGVPWRCLFA